MKKIFIFIMVICCVNFFPIVVFAEDSELIQNASSGLLMEVDTGKIIFKKDILIIIKIINL